MDAFDALLGENCLFSEQFEIPADRFKIEYGQDVPEINLMRAILLNGIESLKYNDNKNPGAAQQIRRQAKAWILANDLNDPYSFVSLCDIFNFEVIRLRDFILKTYGC